jgi:hypothetical protein
MEEQLYFIADVTADLNVAVEGTENMTLEVAEQWIKENQFKLEEPIVIDGTEFDSKYIYKFV